MGPGGERLAILFLISPLKIDHLLLLLCVDICLPANPTYMPYIHHHRPLYIEL